MSSIRLWYIALVPNSKLYLRRAYIVAWSRFIFNASSTPIRSLT